MKTAKRVLAVVIAVIMIVGTCAVAASAETAAENVLAQIANHEATVTLPADTYATLTVNYDCTIDLNGYRLIGDYGTAALKVSNANVTVRDGQVLSRLDPRIPTEDLLGIIGKNSPGAITVKGGSLTVEGVRIVGGMARVPTTPVNNPELVPTGSGIMSYDGAEVTIKRCSIYGDYGVNNNVMGSTPGAKPEIEDAIILAYTRAVKGDLNQAYYGADYTPNFYTIADGSQEIIAADRIAGILNSGITLEPGEKELVGNALNERTMIVVKTPDELTTVLDKDTPTIKVTPGVATAKVEAEVLDYTWENTTGTECSYKMIPEGVKLGDGRIAALDKVPANQVDEACKIVYRVEYKISDETREYMSYITSDDPAVNKLDGCLGWAGLELDEFYNQYANGTTNNGEVDTYEEAVEMLGDVMWKIDNGGSTSIPGYGQLSTMPEFKTLRQKMYALAGVTAYNATETERRAVLGNQYVDFDNATYRAIFDTDMPANGYVGTLDRIDELKNQLEAIRGTSFTKTQNWDELAIWVVETAYPQLYANEDSILNEAIAKLEDLEATLKSAPYDTIIANLDFGGTNPVAILHQAIIDIKATKKGADDVLKNKDVKDTVDYILANKNVIKGYVEKAVDVINNWRTYVTPSNFLVENDTFVKTFTMTGSQEPIIEELNGKLTVIVDGEGFVTFGGGIDDEAAGTDDRKTVDFVDYFELTADPDNGEFLYWVNGETNRILSTESTFTMTTKANRIIEAHFASAPTATFTNPTGAICGVTNAITADGVSTDGINEPYLAGYTFVEWPATTGDALEAETATAYYAGNSVFADPNAWYGENGAVLKINASSSSYIITPKYTCPSQNQNIKVTFLDNGETYEAVGKYNAIATMDQSAYDTAYWKDQSTGEIVCVSTVFPYTLTHNATFYSVAGECPEETVTRTLVTRNNATSKVVLNVERSTKKAFTTTGVVYVVNPEDENFDPETDLTLNAEGAKKGTAKYTTLTGTYNPSFTYDYASGKTIYVRPYIEFADGAPYYGKPIKLVNGYEVQ